MSKPTTSARGSATSSDNRPRNSPYDGPVAIRSMRIRYYRPLPNSGQATKVPSSWHQLLHQMGGSKNLSHYHGKEYSKFCLDKQHL